MGKYEKSMGANELLRALQNHKGSPVSAETEYLAKENLAPAAPVKTNQTTEAKPVFVTLKREPGLPKPTDVVRKADETKKPIVNASTTVPVNANPTKPEPRSNEPVGDGNE